jgi:hypothetical protein
VEIKAYTLNFGSNVTYRLIQDGGSRHFEKTKTVITQSIFVRFQNIWQVGSWHPTKVKNAKPEVTDRFEDGRRRHVGNSSACYKMGNYHPILMKIGTQAKKNILSSKFTKAEV